MIRTSRRVAVILSLGMLAACNQNRVTPDVMAVNAAERPATRETSEVVSTGQDSASSAMDVITAEMTTTISGFATAVCINDMYEIQAADVALQRSKSPGVRDFAHMMRDAHMMTSNELMPLAMAANVELPVTIDARRQEMIENLTGASDEDFDARYKSQQEAAHQEAVILFRGYAENGDHPLIKAFAATTAPTIEHHLEMAKALNTI